jgi:hypothetical protein
MPERTDGVLLVYHRPVAPWIRDASTVREHVRAFGRHSRHRVWEVNSDVGFPPGLAELEFRAVILHYSLFGVGDYRLDDAWLDYLDRTGAYKIAFFQDECTRCGQRFRFLDEHRIDCVFTCLEPSEFEKVYGRYTRVPRLECNVPGYVSEDLVAAGRRFTVPLAERTVDVGYRGRPLPAFLGRGAMEKHEIGVRFGELARGRGLRLDLASSERDRFYGDDWYRFLGGCRCVLGVESGVSAFDLEDEVLAEYTRLSAGGAAVAPEDLTTLERWEDVVYYRTISPRHFEAAALRVCQVLFDGRYSGILEPMVHYIPLRKDFSNLDEVIALVRDDAVCGEIAENAYRDLIASGEWSYGRLLARVDSLVDEAAPAPTATAGAAVVDDHLAVQRRRRRWHRQAEWALMYALRRLPALRKLVLWAHPVTVRVRQLLGMAGPDPAA